MVFSLFLVHYHPIHSNQYMNLCGPLHKCCLKCRREFNMEREFELAKQITIGDLGMDALEAAKFRSEESSHPTNADHNSTQIC